MTPEMLPGEPITLVELLDLLAAGQLRARAVEHLVLHQDGAPDQHVYRVILESETT